MQLTGKQIVERGIITGFSEEGVQQQGIDVRLDKVIEFDTLATSQIGYVPECGKTKLRDRHELKPMENKTNGEEMWHLEPGYYEVIVKEGCKMPNNAAMRFISRSSLVRNGAIIHCGQFDAGFETEQMGFFLQVLFPINIERGARIAQAMIFETAPVENLYQGQWQGDKQRSEQNSKEDEIAKIIDRLKHVRSMSLMNLDKDTTVYDEVVEQVETGNPTQAVLIVQTVTDRTLKVADEVIKRIQNDYLKQTKDN